MRRPRMFVRGPRRRGSFISARAASVGAGSVLIGAMVLGAATSSAYGEIVAGPAVTAPEPQPVAAVAAAEPVGLLGFAPPPELSEGVAGGAGAAPQFRLAADLPVGPLGIPGVVLQAYKLAATRLGSEQPACKLPWFLLAGIGRIESNHASNGSVDEFGTTINPIQGPVLDGSLAGNEVIRDGDGYARAMGPMQFIPTTWAAWGADANGDGKSDPNNIFDATYSAGRYLCAGFTDIMTEQNKVAAVYRYNRSMEYVANVLSWAGAYATGVMPTDPIPEPKRPPEASSKSTPKPKPKPPPRPGAPSTPPSESTTTTTTQPPCFIVCLPPIPLPGQPVPPPKPKPAPAQTPKAGPAR